MTRTTAGLHCGLWLPAVWAVVPEGPALYSMEYKQTRQQKRWLCPQSCVQAGTRPPPRPVLGLSLWRIQSLPGNRTLWRTISAMMHPTDQMSTTKHQVIKTSPRPPCSFLKTPSQQRQAQLSSSMDTMPTAWPSATLSCLQDLLGAGALVWASLGPEG